jgi:NADPH2:quinone reductase
MLAASFTQTGPAATVIHVGEQPTPEPAAGDVRVRIHASGVNPSDVKRRNAAPAGSPAEYPLVIPHSDGAGTIDAVGAGVPESRIGERVWLFNAQFRRPFGTAAEYCVVPAEHAVHLHEDVSFASAASFGIPAMTAYHAVVRAGAAPGVIVLVQGGAGAVGHYAIQFAKRAGATVVTTVSSETKADYVRAAGADHVVNYKTDDLKARIAEITNGNGVDVIVEVDIAANAMTYPDILREFGTSVVYGSGAPTATTPAAYIPRSTTLAYFIVYRLQPDDLHAAIAAVTEASSTLIHTVAHTFPLAETAAAHEAVESGTVIGNVIVQPYAVETGTAV